MGVSFNKACVEFSVYVCGIKAQSGKCSLQKEKDA